MLFMIQVTRRYAAMLLVDADAALMMLIKILMPPRRCAVLC